MNINELLAGVECDCGKHHSCQIKNVYIENNATDHLAEILEDANNILIVADQNTYHAAGEMVVSALSKKQIKKVVFEGKKLLVPNEEAIAAVENELISIEYIVGIGSGVIQDLCKYVSFKNKIPYVIVATAPSMDGYASDGAAMILNGMKVTVPAGLPVAILADPSVLKNAPIDMIRAGYGDIIGKYSALNDWKLSELINGEYFCEWIYDVTLKEVERTVALAEGLINRDEAAITALMEALVVVGIMMSFATSSRPASGSEHHLSHFFEITGILENKPYYPHGIDVGFSTIVTAELREKILSKPFPKERYIMPQNEYISEIRKVYSSSADGCIELQNKAGFYSKDRTEIYLSKETEIKQILSEMPSADKIKNILAFAGYKTDKFYNFYGEDKIRNAVKWAKELKNRYTVLWVNYDLYKGEL